MKEDAIGIYGHISGECGGIGGRLKALPEDFIVNEVSSVPDEDPNGRYVFARVRSRNWETNRLIRQLSRILGISRRRIYFAGTKDKRAITTQAVVFDAPLEDVLSLRLKDVSITDVRRVSSPIFLGDLSGNRFEIIVREAAEGAYAAAGCVRERIDAMGGFPNFFGVQRFGSVRPITHIIGKHLVRKDFRAAVEDYLGSPSPLEGEDAYRARKQFAETGDVETALRSYPNRLGFEKAMLNHLAAHPEDWKGAIGILPRNLSRMFIHAYQSYLFNMILSRRMKDGLLGEVLKGDIVIGIYSGIPVKRELFTVKDHNIDRITKRVRDGKAAVTGAVFGHDAVLAGGVQGEIEREIIEKEGLSPEDFRFSEPEYLTSAGNRRALISAVMELEMEPMPENSMKFSFMLPRGCYATSLLREFMKVDELTAYG